MSACGQFIPVGTMAFRHASNGWQFAPDGTVIADRHFPPWAPMQVATVAGGRAVAVGLADSRVTSPDPTVWLGSSRELFGGPLHDGLVQVDSSDAQLARLRAGTGDWRTGRFTSYFGELLVRGPDWLDKPPLEWLDSQGQRQSLRDMGRNLLPTSRAMRMAASDDGTRLAFGWLGLSEPVEGLPRHRNAVSAWSVGPNRERWSGVATTRARLEAVGIDRVTHVLQTHSHGDHAGWSYLWRALGARIVAPRPAALTLTWLMPMLSDYGVYPPQPVDMPLPLVRAGDNTDFETSGLHFHALFVPGHSFDHTIYTIELGGKRIAFTGDLGFENQDILHRTWGDAEKARVALRIVRDHLMPWDPEIVFTGHGVRLDGWAFLSELLEHTERSLEALEGAKEGG